MKNEAHRYNEIDLLRGVACLSVVAFHYLSRGPKAGWMTGVDYPLAESVARYGYLGVHLFFVISGFVILMSAQSATPRAFFASRVARLYPALWIGATLTAGTAWLLGDLRFMVTLKTYLVNLTMLPHWFNVPYVDGAYWSLAYELHFYIYVWLAIRLGLMRHLQWLLIAWLVISAVNALRPMWPVIFWLNAKWAPFFVAGGAFFLIRTQGMSRVRMGLVAASYGLALVYSLQDAQSMNPAAGEPPLVQLPLVAAFVTLIFTLFWLISIGRLQMKASRLTAAAGALTYPLYLVHEFFGFMLYEKLRLTTGNVAVSLLTTTAIVFAISWVIHVSIERPIGPRLRRRLDQLHAPMALTSSAKT